MNKLRKPLVFACAGATVALAIGFAVSAFAGGHANTGVPAGVVADVPAAFINVNYPKPKTRFLPRAELALKTTSTSFVSVPGMELSFKQGGRVAGCIIVHTSAFTFAANTTNDIEWWRVTLDGVGCNPTEVQASGDDTVVAREHAAVWACTNVTPGAHTVAFQFRTEAGEEVFIHKPAMSIEHA